VYKNGDNLWTTTITSELSTVPAGRPKGAKNKKLGLGRDYLVEQFGKQKWEPGLFLIGVANGSDTSEQWDKRDRIQASKILMAHTYDKPQRESQQALIEELRALHRETAPIYEIVYEQDSSNKFVPPASGSAMAAG
jgi:hypothetical protein